MYGKAKLEYRELLHTIFVPPHNIIGFPKFLLHCLVMPLYDFHVEHYKLVASQYDRFTTAQARTRANFIQECLALSPDDQIVDVGGGTALVSLMVHSDVGMTKPVVCVDPSPEMLSIARENGAITVQATAEEFFLSEPDYPLRVIFMNGCVHHFDDADLVFSNLAKLLPDDGECFVSLGNFPANITLPWFKAEGCEYPATEKVKMLSKLIESKGLQCRLAFNTQSVEVEKERWYDCIRNRYRSTLMPFSDQELEDGIRELEREFEDLHTLKLDFDAVAIIVTKKLNSV